MDHGQELREDRWVLGWPSVFRVPGVQVQNGRTGFSRLNPGIRDFYDENDQFTVTPKDRKDYRSFLDSLEPWERATFDRAIREDRNYYVLNFSNKGGLVMPIILGLTFSDGSTERMNIPAEIWRRDSRSVTKLLNFPKGKELTEVVVDPNWETADADIENNYYPRRIRENKFRLSKPSRPSNPLRDQKKADEKARKEAEAKAKKERDKKTSPKKK